MSERTQKSHTWTEKKERKKQSASSQHQAAMLTYTSKEGDNLVEIHYYLV